MKPFIGLVLAFTLGLASWVFGISSPAPPLVLGALLVVVMKVGHIVIDQYAMSPAQHKPDCG